MVGHFLAKTLSLPLLKHECDDFVIVLYNFCILHVSMVRLILVLSYQTGLMRRKEEMKDGKLD